jgi:hypothetical protein
VGDEDLLLLRPRELSHDRRIGRRRRQERQRIANKLCHGGVEEEFMEICTQILTGLGLEVLHLQAATWNLEFWIVDHHPIAHIAMSDQARLRRERREKRIRSQGSSRLEKIAGLQGGASAREVLHPDPPEADISELRPAPTRRRRSSEHLVDGDDEQPFNVLRGQNDPYANMPEELKNDPLMKLLLNSPGFGAGATGGSAVEDENGDDLNNLAEKISKQLLGQLSGQKQEPPVVEISKWKWKFARIVSVVSLLAYMWFQLEDYHFSRDVDSAAFTTVTSPLI